MKKLSIANWPRKVAVALLVLGCLLVLVNLLGLFIY